MKTVAEVSEWVERIRVMQFDDEIAHSEEDGLRQAVLESIATGTSDDPQGMAEEALRTGEINFARWCVVPVASPRLQGALREALAEVDALRSLLYRSLPALGTHARGFSQEVLIKACRAIGADPEDWTAHADTMERRRRILDGNPSDEARSA